MRDHGREEPKVNTRSAVSRLLQLMRPYSAQLILCMIFALLANAAALASPAVASVIIDDFLREGKEQRGLYSILGFGILYLLVEIAGSFFGLMQQRRVARISQSILHTMREQVFDKILHMPISQIDDNGTGRLITRATNDVETVNEFYSDIFINLFKDVFLLIGIAGVMIAFDPYLALLSLTGVPFIFLITFSLKKLIKNNFKKVKAITGQINGFIAENISGMRIVKAYNRQKHKLREFVALNHRYFKGTVTQIVLNSVLHPSMEVINNLVIALLLVASFGRISDGALKLGVLYAFTNYVKKFFEPINDLAEKYTSVQSAFVSVDRIGEILDAEGTEMPEEGTRDGAVIGDIEFDNVCFSYDGKTPVLKNVSFHLKPGTKAAFVGATGAGKTTVISLLCRYYVPDSGRILVDGTDIREWKLRDLRRGISAVMQNVFLFDGNVRDNIDMHASLTDEKITEALVAANADEFVSEIGGIDARVYEQGLNFSTGQRQLLSFARAVATDPGVLILDEATANIDSVTEERIQSAIGEISRGRTCVFIAHRLSTIRDCDIIFLLDRGVIVERGTHGELMALGGGYAALVNAAAENGELE
ncbi:MAG: ABC transporter ATP-binding protein [Ruminococcaceae bacterium]|nr:ABC transporter ATP-binding protein [Oscillospiraceae bacterium]